MKYDCSINKDRQMNCRESDKSIISLILRIISLEEKRDLLNIALDRETLSKHRVRKKKQQMKQQNIMETKLARITKILTKKNICKYICYLSELY